MLKILKNCFLQTRFYLSISSIIILFIISYITNGWLTTVKLILSIFLLSCLIDLLILNLIKKGISAKRSLPERLSNGDLNTVKILIKNFYPFTIKIDIIDEIPIQFQKRDVLFHKSIKSNKDISFNYTLRPTCRGVYNFGHLNIFVKSPIGFIARKYTLSEPTDIACYPSFIQLKKFDLIALSLYNQYGLRQIRRIGHTMEFEQIKEYVQGDDIRTINWKATAKRNLLMVNQYQDETSQAIYSIINKGRVMKMPFNGLSLLDYAINTALVISNIILKKKDNAGLLTFSNTIENSIIAENKPNQLERILNSLYHIETNFFESDFDKLHNYINRIVKQRSLLFLYTNFETLDELDRQMPYLQSLSKHHVLVVIFFINTEMDDLLINKPKTTKAIYHQTIAQQLTYDKKLIVKKLKSKGVYSILTKPQELNAQVINKYLNLKARGII